MPEALLIVRFHTGFNRKSASTKNTNQNDDMLSEAIIRGKRDDENRDCEARSRRTAPIFSPFPSLALAKVKDINAAVAKLLDRFISKFFSNIENENI